MRAFFEAAVGQGAEVLHEPRLWQEYHPNYYSTFVRTPTATTSRPCATRLTAHNRSRGGVGVDEDLGQGRLAGAGDVLEGGADAAKQVVVAEPTVAYIRTSTST